jgi:uncharacterized membrane protein
VRHGERTARASLGVLSIALAAALFTAGTFAAPRLETVAPGWAPALRALYAPVCHQRPERSLAVGGGHQAVCARCSGLYLGGVAGLALGALLARRGRLRPRAAWLAAAALPTALDATLPWVGFAGADNLTRLLLALPLGCIAGLFLARGLEDLFQSWSWPAEQESGARAATGRR